MTPMYEIATRVFEKLSAMRKAALQTKPPTAINITGKSGINITGKQTDEPPPRTNFNQGEHQ